MKVKDLNGVVVDGIERGPNNSLIVTDKKAYNKYISEKERVQRLNKLEHEVSEIKDSLTTILHLLREKQV